MIEMIEKVLLITVVIVFPILTYYLTKYLVERSIKKALTQFVDPYLKSMNLRRTGFEKIPSKLLSPFKAKGDFDLVPLSPFNDTSFNRKIFFYLSYADAEGKPFRVTVMVFNNFFLNPRKVEFFPVIRS